MDAVFRCATCMCMFVAMQGLCCFLRARMCMWMHMGVHAYNNIFKTGVARLGLDGSARQRTLMKCATMHTICLRVRASPTSTNLRGIAGHALSAGATRMQASRSNCKTNRTGSGSAHRRRATVLCFRPVGRQHVLQTILKFACLTSTSDLTARHEHGLNVEFAIESQPAPPRRQSHTKCLVVSSA